MQPVPSAPHLAPRRRFRGKRRYFRRLQSDAASFELVHSPSAWWDLWHYHADWPGWGNRGWRFRRQHLEALAVVFRKIIADKDHFSTPFQTWLHIAQDAGLDAVYLHTPSPSSTPFPLVPPDTEWDVTDLDEVLAAILPGVRLRTGVWRGFDPNAEPPGETTVYTVYSPDCGIPLAEPKGLKGPSAAWPSRGSSRYCEKNNAKPSAA